MTIQKQKDAVLKALSAIIDPDLNQDIVSLGFVKDLVVTDKGAVSFAIELTTPACPVKDEFKAEAQRLVDALDWVTAVSITMTAQTPKARADQMKGFAKVGSIIAVASCKGGVGKSTVAVNLAAALSKKGAKVGLFDADIYGPSFSMMLRLDDTQPKLEGKYLLPYDYEGMKLMSLSYLKQGAEDDAPAILRGPMVSQLITQLLSQTKWGELDYLILDMPPGTGDIQLTIGQLLKLSAAVMVTTPQMVSMIDVVKGIEMFDTLKVPTIAAVENMSFMRVAGSDTPIHPFGQGALYSLRSQYGFENTVALPVLELVSQAGDSGRPLFFQDPDSEFSSLIKRLADQVVTELAKLLYHKIPLPKIGYAEKQGVLFKYEGREGFAIPVDRLRAACCCAHCKDELTGKQLYDPSTMPADLHPLSMNPVGNYALGVNWSDGHASLYPYKSVEALLVSP
ncbi:MAG: P-loop NTPase [bacterium]